MATPYQEGNKMPLGSGGGPQSSKGRVEAIVDKTKGLAFPSEPVISLENFESKGDKGAGWQNSLAEMQTLTGKELQESYRSGLSQSAQYHDKVTDH